MKLNNILLVIFVIFLTNQLIDAYSSQKPSFMKKVQSHTLAQTQTSNQVKTDCVVLGGPGCEITSITPAKQPEKKQQRGQFCTKDKDCESGLFCIGMVCEKWCKRCK